MPKLSSLSLFTRLYLTIALAMLVSGTLSVFVINKIHVQGAIDDYVVFTDNIYADLLKEKKVDHNTPLKDLNEEEQDVEGHLIGWKIIFNPDLPCENCEYVASSGKVEVYRNMKNQWFAIYKLPNVEAWLAIFENNIFNLGPEVDHEDTGIFSELKFHDVEDLTQLMIVFFTIAIAIYWPVRVIKRQIENLIETQHQFGAGDLQARASDIYTKPLDELATSFNSMASAISDTVNENQIFAQSVPHEVRTPLSRIQLAVGLLSQNNNNKQQVQLLDNIDTYIGDISELINQVVAFSKLNSVKDESEVSLYQTIKLSEFIESRVEATKCNERLTVIRHFKDSLKITTNPAYLRLLIDNLLKNASIHAKNEIVITLHTVNEQVQLIVEDDGDGIPDEYLDTIFIPFSRLDVSRSRKTGGLGLGLAICQAACKRMNSKLTVENTSASGAKFTCQFQ